MDLTQTVSIISNPCEFLASKRSERASISSVQWKSVIYIIVFSMVRSRARLYE